MSDYVLARETWIEEILSEAHASGRVSLTRDEVKEAFLMGLHCGNYRGLPAFQQRGYAQLDAYRAGVKQAVTQLYHLQMFQELREQAIQRNASNPVGSFVAHLCQQVEGACLAICHETLAKQGVETRVNMYDGLMATGWASMAKSDQDGLLRACERSVYEKLGFPIVLEEKPLKEYSEEDYAAAVRTGTSLNDEYDLVTDDTPNMIDISTRYVSHGLWCDAKDKQDFEASGSDSKTMDCRDIATIPGDLYMRVNRV